LGEEDEFSKNKKNPFLVDKKGFLFLSHLIFQGIATLLELAPASRL